MTENQNELKPCPFCGLPPKITERPNSAGEGGGRSCFITCFCGGFSARAWQRGVGDNDKIARDHAMAQWNTRATPQQSTIAPYAGWIMK